MPKLLLFAACEKVIVGDEQQVISLIAIMEAVNVGVATIVPKDTPLIAPTVWFAFSLWEREETDKNGSFYEQKVELVLPNDKIALATEPVDIEFIEGKRNNRAVFRMVGFPLPPTSGLMRVRLLIKEKAVNNGWRETGSFPIEITLSSFELPQPPPNPDAK